jgi:signal transduction histidine kinase
VRILVVDDHPNTADMLARALSQLGPLVDVISATSGPEALEKVAYGSVDILITDMIMPEMTGLELIEKLKSHPGGSPAFIYLITAYDVPGLKETARRLKVNDIILKPVRPERICLIVMQDIEKMGQAAAGKSKAVSSRKFRILVADDQPDNFVLLSRYLENEGYEHLAAVDGQETLDKMRDELPDLVLLDINMPNKDGFVVLKEIRSDPAIEHIPVIMLTAARIDSADVQSGLNLGADDYVTKPFDRRDLMARIRTKLRVKEAQDQIRRRNRELSLLPEIGKELSARLDIEDLANVVLKRTVETLGAYQGHIFLLNPAGEIQQGYHFPEAAAALFRQESLFLASFIEKVKETRQGVIFDDTATDSRWLTLPGDQTNSAVVTPLSGRRDLLGLLILTHERAGYFQLEHLLLLQAIASQAAIAIENARLYASMAQQEKRLSAVLQNAAEAIFMFDADGRLNLMNPAGDKLFTDFKASLDRPLEAGHGYDGLINLLEDARLSGFSRSGEIIWPDKRTFMALITPIESGGLVAILHDVSRFKDIERVKNEFIASASHDLKNPIMSIAGYGDLISKAGPLNELQADFAHRIQTAAQTMGELVQNMLQLANADLQAAQKYEPVEMGALLVEMADEFTPQAALKKQRLSFDPLTETAVIQGNPLQLRQLFRNLLGNAIKYTPEGGQILLVADLGQQTLQVGVQDTGIGIPAADLPFIFDRFYRARAETHNLVEGNGLGLAIVKSIVELHGGQVSVESEEGFGSTFSVSLPLLSRTVLAS